MNPLRNLKLFQSHMRRTYEKLAALDLELASAKLAVHERGIAGEEKTRRALYVHSLWERQKWLYDDLGRTARMYFDPFDNLVGARCEPIRSPLCGILAESSGPLCREDLSRAAA